MALSAIRVTRAGAVPGAPLTGAGGVSRRRVRPGSAVSGEPGGCAANRYPAAAGTGRSSATGAGSACADLPSDGVARP